MFEVKEIPDPVPGRFEVVIRVAAAGVNRADILQGQGKYPAPAGVTDVPGLEVAGTVVQRGDGVKRLSLGDEVVALLPGGGYAELAVVDERLALPRPRGATWEESSAVIEAACTVVSNLDTAGARGDETVLVHGGSGGVGTLGIQIAKARGMTVWTTAGSAARADRCRELGADLALPYGAEATEAFAERGGADVILDVAGGPTLKTNVGLLRDGGRLVVIGLQGGRRGELDLGALLAKRARVIGTTLRSRPLEERAAIVAAVEAEVWPRIPDAVRPVLHEAFALEDAARAHAALESGAVFGKVVLVPERSD